MAAGETVGQLNYWCRAGWAARVFCRGWMLVPDCWKTVLSLAECKMKHRTAIHVC